MALASFAPSGTTFILGSDASQSAVLPTSGSPTICLVTNVGNGIAYVLLGDSEVTVPSATGLALLPGTSIALTIGANTNIAAVGQTQLNIAVGS